jgi:4-nitrophenyl phosphatase
MYRGVVLDLDGTVYRGGSPIEGAPAAVERLRDRGLNVLFFSNNPTKTRVDYVERLAEMGVEATVEEVLSAGTVTTEYLLEHHPDEATYLIGAPGLREQLVTADLPLTDDTDAAEVLVTSWTDAFDYRGLTDAYRAGKDGATFLGTDPDRLVPASGDRMVPGSGAITNAVAGVLEREPDRVLGKPSAEAIAMAREALGVPLEECLVVGDRLNTDLALGEAAGMTTVLVRTGVATDADVERSEVTPDHVLDSLADIDTVLDAAGS